MSANQHKQADALAVVAICCFGAAVCIVMASIANQSTRQGNADAETDIVEAAPVTQIAVTATRRAPVPLLAWVQLNNDGTANVHIIRTPTERESLFDLAVRPASSVPTTDNASSNATPEANTP